eukprot:CAMPEP_0119081082 /NCGR_PEP_ID=MMETSP1178-20130426/115112_1 /TAXON_ID=33656 /ORGANISM="unid sp, Strain CCMP2000" /LENGTH=79 /DNA_ID=CAMNT_0007063743 /DNA_START=20 /DNA_END=256 /DNA_ORIENTATION=+
MPEVEEGKGVSLDGWTASLAARLQLDSPGSLRECQLSGGANRPAAFNVPTLGQSMQVGLEHMDPLQVGLQQVGSLPVGP